MASNRTSLRRSCQGCVKVKRRCDLLFPQCTRCLKKGVRCEYVNVPLSGQTQVNMTNRVTNTGPDVPEQAFSNGILLYQTTRSPRNASCLPSLPMDHRLEVELTKTREPDIIRLIASEMRSVPVVFAQKMHAAFIHPCLYETSLPAPVQEIHALCNLCLADGSLYSFDLYPILQRRIAYLAWSAKRSASYEELLACVQALCLAQCVRLTEQNGDEQNLDVINGILTDLARQLWQQAPYHLPSSMSLWRAWVFAESVRRTIIFAHVLCATFSLLKRGFANRTPFVDALPFDIRTWLWDIQTEDEWEEANSNSSFPMVSLYEYTTMLAAGTVQGSSTFESIITAACKGKEIPIRNLPMVENFTFQRGATIGHL